jgi:hypothetical protein
MDTLRGFDRDAAEAELDLSGFEDDAPSEPPPVVGQDERRMQVRAYNYWASLLGEHSFPSVATLLAGQYPDFADNLVLLHFDEGIEDPAITFLGAKLADECGTESSIERLSQVPGRSLLSRITDHYMQIIANQAPIGFEAEFVNHFGRTILYRGILLPFSSDGTRIDYIMGAINWKELADQATTDELLLEIGQALDAAPIKAQPRRPLIEPTDAWADGPASLEADAFPEPAFGLDDDILPLPAAAPAGNEPEALADWLASARELALVANSSEDRTRSALYAAIGRAWDFALAAQAEPEEFAELLQEAGLTMQERAPMTPVVKLVFGADYDRADPCTADRAGARRTGGSSLGSSGRSQGRDQCRTTPAPRGSRQGAGKARAGSSRAIAAGIAIPQGHRGWPARGCRIRAGRGASSGERRGRRLG